LRGNRPPPSNKGQIKLTQQAEEYRQAREAELAQLQQALEQIAETRRTAVKYRDFGSSLVRWDADPEFVLFS